MPNFSKEWEKATATISREQLGPILAEETFKVYTAALLVNGNDTADLIKDLMLEFSASVATRIFEQAEDIELG